MDHLPGGGWLAASDPRGQIRNVDVLFGRYSDVTLQHLLANATYRDIGTVYERASPMAAAWIINKQVWKLLFARDYPLQYALATDAEGDMNEETRYRLSMLTPQAKRYREHTYWKRYYEFIIKLRPIAADEPPAWFNASWSSRMPYRRLGMATLDDAFELWSPAQAAVMQERSTVAYIVHGAISMIQVRLQRAFSFPIIPYDATLLASQIVFRRGRGTCEFYSPDLFTLIYFSSEQGKFARRFVSVELVSACVVCAKVGAELMQVCGGCEAHVYCGEACANAHWVGIHHLECAAAGLL